MTELELKSNNLVGEIPHALLAMGARSLQVLNLSRNELTGQIPDSFAECASLKELFLSWNKLHGRMPPSIAGWYPRQPCHLQPCTLTQLLRACAGIEPTACAASTCKSSTSRAIS